MEMTAAILFHALGQTVKTDRIDWGVVPVTVSSVHVRQEDGTIPSPESGSGLQPSELYVESSRIYTADPRGPAFYPAQTVCAADLAAKVTETWNGLNEWELDMCDGILRGDAPERIFDPGTRYLHRYYALIDRRLSSIYMSPFLAREMDAAGQGRSVSGFLPQAAGPGLLLEKEFHESVHRKCSFYYNEDSAATVCYCRNIFIDRQYFGRLVMYLEPDETSLTRGEEQIFDLFADRMQQYYQNTAHLRSHTRTDLLQHLCQTLLSGNTVSRQTIDNTLHKTGWQSRHRYVLMELRFFETPGWNTHLENTLPYLSRQLEKEWEHSCVFTWEQKIICLINLSLSAPAEKNRAATDELKEICRKLAVFIRDNICHAGVSSVFEDFSLLETAAEQARAALSVGSRKDPGFWYFLFDQYRLDFYLSTLQSSLKSAMLQHPAVRELAAYDEENHTELVPTLRAYLYSGLNMTAAAESMYVHRTTFCRRMDRILALTSLKLNDPDTLMELMISLRLTEGQD